MTFIERRGVGTASLVVAFSAVALLASSARATDIAAGSYGTEVWTAAGSPYLVQGDVTIADLTVEAGTTVLVSSTNTVANRNVIISVNAIEVRGLPGSPVVFQAETDTTSSHAYQGLWISGPASIAYAEIRNAQDGLDFKAGTAEVRQSWFETNSYSIINDGADVVVDGITVVNVNSGIWMPNLGTHTLAVSNSVFQNINSTAIFSEIGNVSVVNCTFDHTRGIEYYPASTNTSATSGTIDVRNSIFSNGAGLVVDMASSPGVVPVSATISHSNLWGNVALGFTMGAGNIAADPLYVSATDLHLRAGSPCIDSAGAAGAPDHDRDLATRPKEGDGVPDTDGSSFDIGAYEFDPLGTGGTGGAGGGSGTGGTGIGGGAETGGSGGAASTGSGGGSGTGGAATGGGSGTGGAATGGGSGTGGAATGGGSGTGGAATGGAATGGGSGTGGAATGGGSGTGGTGTGGSGARGGSGAAGGSTGMGVGSAGSVGSGGGAGTGGTAGGGGATSTGAAGRGGTGGAPPGQASSSASDGCSCALGTADEAQSPWAWIIAGVAVGTRRRRRA